MRKNAVLNAAWSVLSLSQRRKIVLGIFVQIFLACLDLLAVASMGVLGVLAVSGIQSTSANGRVLSFIEFFHLESFSFQKQFTIIALSASFILIGKTVASAVLSRKMLFFVARIGASISEKLTALLLNQPLLSVQSRSSQESLFALTSGVSALTLGIIGAGISALSDLALLIIMLIGLALVDLGASISSMLFFGAVALALYRMMRNTANSLGDAQTSLSISSNESILEAINSYRENFVRDRRGFYVAKISKLRFDLAEASAGMAFMSNISKYVLEAAMVLGGLLLCAFQFTRTDAANAVGILAVFLTAGSRVVPAVLRLQQSAVQIKSSAGMASPTINLIASIGLQDISLTTQIFVDSPTIKHEGFIPSIIIKQVEFQYPTSSLQTLKPISLSIEIGSHVAFVGPSGAGKSTLIDLVLGILNPDKGEVLISGQSPSLTLREWPGAISYVPQDIVIINGTIKDNVCLGFDSQKIDDKIVWEALESAHLNDLVSNLPNQLLEQVGDRGTKLSGGQRQRLGLARAMLTKPKLLILDEATSALDGQVESNISLTLEKLKPEITLISIAHRLSTIKNADVVVYLDNGLVRKVGNFDEVRSAVPDFDKQAKLMGM